MAGSIRIKADGREDLQTPVGGGRTGKKSQHQGVEPSLGREDSDGSRELELGGDSVFREREVRKREDGKRSRGVQIGRGEKIKFSSDTDLGEGRSP